MLDVLFSELETEVNKTCVFIYNIPNENAFITWNIDKVLNIILKKPRQALPFPKDQMAIVANSWDTNETKLINADITKWGVIAPLRWLPDGSLNYILIDGVHRVCKAFLQDKPFYCYPITPQESKECIIAYSGITLPE